MSNLTEETKLLQHLKDQVAALNINFTSDHRLVAYKEVQESLKILISMRNLEEKMRSNRDEIQFLLPNHGHDISNSLNSISQGNAQMRKKSVGSSSNPNDHRDRSPKRDRGTSPKRDHNLSPRLIPNDQTDKGERRSSDSGKREKKSSGSDGSSDKARSHSPRKSNSTPSSNSKDNGDTKNVDPSASYFTNPLIINSNNNSNNSSNNTNSNAPKSPRKDNSSTPTSPRKDEKANMVNHVVEPSERILKPRTSYHFYVEEKSAEYRKDESEHKSKPAEFLKQLGNHWKNLTNDEKHKYYEMEYLDEKRYKDDVDKNATKYEQLAQTQGAIPYPMQYV